MYETKQKEKKDIPDIKSYYDNKREIKEKYSKLNLPSDSMMNQLGRKYNIFSPNSTGYKSMEKLLHYRKHFGKDLDIFTFSKGFVKYINKKGIHKEEKFKTLKELCENCFEKVSKEFDVSNPIFRKKLKERTYRYAYELFVNKTIAGQILENKLKLVFTKLGYKVTNPTIEEDTSYSIDFFIDSKKLGGKVGVQVKPISYLLGVNSGYNSTMNNVHAENVGKHQNIMEMYKNTDKEIKKIYYVFYNMKSKFEFGKEPTNVVYIIAEDAIDDNNNHYIEKIASIKS